VDDRRNIRPHGVDGEVHIHLAGRLAAAGEQTALKINNDDVGSLQEEFAQACWRNEQTRVV
jgi:hypothetical protein